MNGTQGFITVVVCAALAGAWGCEEKPATRRDRKNTENYATERGEDTAQTPRSRQQELDDTELAMDKLREEIKEFQVNSDERADRAGEKWDRWRVTLEEKTHKAEERMADARAAAADNWEDMVDATKDALRELDEAFKDAQQELMDEKNIEPTPPASR